MPGYVIHLCVAKEYIIKHGIENEKDFFDGTVYPDGKKDKNITHYSGTRGSAGTNLYKFLQDKKLNSSFNEGWFLHLLSDYLFYNKYFDGWKYKDRELLYNDYDILNQSLIKKYNLTYVPPNIEKYFNTQKKGQTIEYHYDKVIKFIDDVSNYDLHELGEKIILNKDYKFLCKEV